MSIFQYFCASISDIWARILLWAFITTTVVYSTGGVYSAVAWRRTKPMAFVCPLLYFIFGALKFVIVDLITCMYMCMVLHPLFYGGDIYRAISCKCGKTSGMCCVLVLTFVGCLKNIHSKCACVVVLSALCFYLTIWCFDKQALE